MCGICGIYNRDYERPVSYEIVQRMSESIRHRGPDDFGIHCQGNVGLGHRRLSIIDLHSSRQPLSNEDETIWISYNGEIYNFQELRAFLIKRGHKFKTSGDSEVIVHLYEEYGTEFVKYMNGMFAIALWDSKCKSLFLFRDRLGIKPLYYFIDSEYLVFASEIKALKASGLFQLSLNQSVVFTQLMYGAVYGSETLIKDVFELPPASYLTISTTGVRIMQYWDISQAEADYRSPKDIHDKLEELLKASVERRLMSDVPLGAFLSGGVDSSLIVAMMTDALKEPVKTFSIGFGDENGNEFEYSRYIAKEFNTDHHEYLFSEDIFFEYLPKLIWHQDEPIRHHASIPLFFLSAFTKGKATVLLTGEGADENFAGYRKYRLANLQNKVNKVYQTLLPNTWGKWFASWGAGLSDKKIFSKVISKLDASPAILAALYGPALPKPYVSGIINEEIFPTDDLNASIVEDYFLKAPFDSFIDRYLYADIFTYLQTLLMKQDKMSMAASIESRVPFLDHELVEFAFNLNSNWKVKGSVSKYVLKKVAERRLPENLVYRRKMGFPVPLTKWLLNGSFDNFLRVILFEPKVRSRGFYNLSFLEQHIQDIKRGVWGYGSDASNLLWNTLNFEIWYRIFIESEDIGSICQKDLSNIEYMITR